MIRSRGFLLVALRFIFALSAMALRAPDAGRHCAAGAAASRAAGAPAGGGSAGRMTAEEKARLLAGSGWMESYPTERLGIPAIKMADGPMGVRNWAGSSAVTNAAGDGFRSTPRRFPRASAWRRAGTSDLVQAEGRVIAQQVKALGRDMILAPTVNVNRTPLWGRNFEGYGEDPYLAARMAVAFIQGVQGEGVIPSVKHFAANNQEFERHRIDAKVDLRTLHEIYFPAFKAAVEEAGVWTVMSAYNKVNGQWCAENPFLLTETLRKRWGFKGFVISDWGSTYSTAGTINAGMDLEMPGGEPMRVWLASPQSPRRGQQRRMAHRREDSGRGGLRPGEAGRGGRQRASPAERHVQGPPLRPAARWRWRSGYARAACRSTPSGDREHGAAAERGGAAAPRLGEDALRGGDRTLRRRGAHGRRRQLARASEVRRDAPRGHQGGGRRPGAGELRPGRRHGRRGRGVDARTARDEAVALAARSDAAVVVAGYSSKLESEGFDRRP